MLNHQALLWSSDEAFAGDNRLGAHRHSNIKRTPHRSSEKTWCRNTNDLKRMALNRNRVANYWRAPVVRIPEPIAQHGDTRAAAFIIRFR